MTAAGDSEGLRRRLLEEPLVRPTRRSSPPARRRVVRPPRVSEAGWQKKVTDCAEWRGWLWVHFRAARTGRDGTGWRTPVEGPLGKGWVDLVLVRPRDCRLIFAELKRDGECPDADQRRVHEVLGAVAVGIERVEQHVWRPADWERVQAVLR